MTRAEVRLRLVETLTRGHCQLAINDPARFLSIVAEMERFVVQDDPSAASCATPADGPVKRRRRRRVETDKPAE